MNNLSEVTNIKIWLIQNGYTQTRIANDLKISRQTVWKTVHGRDRNRKVEQWLKNHQCPLKLSLE